MAKMISFYRPKAKAEPKPVAAEHEDQVPDIPAKEVLEQIMPHAGAIDTILVCMRLKGGGKLDFVTNLNGEAESLLFLKVFEHKILQSQTDLMGSE